MVRTSACAAVLLLTIAGALRQRVLLDSSIQRDESNSSIQFDRGSLPYDKALFMATHNSYEFKSLGVVQQLNFGVRQIEFDIYAHEFRRYRQYCVGHDECFDDDTQHGEKGNPRTDFLNEWLKQVMHWSNTHRNHAPISIMLDMKTCLQCGGRHHDDGGLSNLQDTVRHIFGKKLYWARERLSRRSWPTVNQLRNKILVTLSGSSSSREAYALDKGYNQRFAVNNAGLVVEVHQSHNADRIYYWTGKVTGKLNHKTLFGNKITWFRHAKYDSGRDAAVALGEDNTVVEVHKSQNHNEIWYKVGTLNRHNMEITWGHSHKYDSGKDPTIKITSHGRVQERHRSARTNKVWVRDGTIDVRHRRIHWHGRARQVNWGLWDHETAWNPRRSVRIARKNTWGRPMYEVNWQGWRYIYYQQMFFIDWQPGCSGGKENYPPLKQAVFIGINRKCHHPKRVNGKVTRVWQYNMNDARHGKEYGSFPATDHPDSRYKNWVASKSNGITF